MEIKTKADYDAFLRTLEELCSGEDFIKFQTKIVNTKKQIIGVKSPQIRQLAKDIFKSNHVGLFKYGNNNVFEEVLVKGLVIGMTKDIDFALDQLNRLVLCFDTWAETDMICANFAFFKENEERFTFGSVRLVVLLYGESTGEGKPIQGVKNRHCVF